MACAVPQPEVRLALVMILAAVFLENAVPNMGIVEIPTATVAPLPDASLGSESVVLNPLLPRLFPRLHRRLGLSPPLPVLHRSMGCVVLLTRVSLALASWVQMASLNAAVPMDGVETALITVESLLAARLASANVVSRW